MRKSDLSKTYRIRGEFTDKIKDLSLDFIIENITIVYWIYGHHHCNVGDFEIKNTKLLTNQLGYIKYNENRGFNDKAIFSI